MVSTSNLSQNLVSHPQYFVKIVAAGKGVTVGRPKIIDKVLELCGKNNPNVAYLGTPSLDEDEYWKKIGLVYEQVGCNVTKLDLWNHFISSDAKERRKKKTDVACTLTKADIILVSGGLSKRAVEKWREFGIDHLLIQVAFRVNPPVIAGGSAGALCLFIRGLGLVPATVVPHFDALDTHPKVPLPHKVLAKHPTLPCIGIDEEAAFVIDGDKATVVSVDGRSKCYHICKRDGIVTVPLFEDDVIPLSKLGIYLEFPSFGSNS